MPPNHSSVVHCKTDEADINLVDVVVSEDPEIRDRSLAEWCYGRSSSLLWDQCRSLEDFRRASSNLYHKVRAIMFAYALLRYHVVYSPCSSPRRSCRSKHKGRGKEDEFDYDYQGWVAMAERRFDDAVIFYWKVVDEECSSVADEISQTQTMGPNRQSLPSEAIASAMAGAYYQLGFQTLADQVKASVRSYADWMFRDDENENPMRTASLPPSHPPPPPPTVLRRELVTPICSKKQEYPFLIEQTPVRMDFSHSAWSDIFFLGMDCPDLAAVLNVSVDLAVAYPRRQPDVPVEPIPPIEVRLQVVSLGEDNDRAPLRLTSIDMKSEANLFTVKDVFDFGNGDHLGLLRAGIVAGGLVPPYLESYGEMDLGLWLDIVIGCSDKSGPSGLGLELTTHVRGGIPKGSRLAISTNLLCGIVSVLLRAFSSPPVCSSSTAEKDCLEGPLSESDRRTVAARALLGEWMGGSGGGWQDSGGVWPGVKVMRGVTSTKGDPEYGVSRGRLLPEVSTWTSSETFRQALRNSLVVVHGGMAQNVGPILELVTERYLLRHDMEARREAFDLFGKIVEALHKAKVAAEQAEMSSSSLSPCDCSTHLHTLAKLCTRNFYGPLQTLIPPVTNHYTEALVDGCRQRFGDQFWGFWMMGGMSGGGMGFFFNPDGLGSARAAPLLYDLLLETKRRMERSLPFAMDPVVYDVSINDVGTTASLETTTTSFTPPTKASNHNQDKPIKKQKQFSSPEEVLNDLGLEADPQRFQIQSDYVSGKIGLKANLLSSVDPTIALTDVSKDDVVLTDVAVTQDHVKRGLEELRNGRVGVVTLAAGVGSRWTGGAAGVVKALHPFTRLGGRHRSFIDVHVAKTRKASFFGEKESSILGNGNDVNDNANDAQSIPCIPHVFTTSHLTHEPISAELRRIRHNPLPSSQNSNDDDNDNGNGNNENKDGQGGLWYISPGKVLGIRMVPTVRDLQHYWSEQAPLDGQAQKVRESSHRATLEWVSSLSSMGGGGGEANFYFDEADPTSCLAPVGHWHEIPNMVTNGVLKQILLERPNLRTLMVHNVDTVGANVDPGLLGHFVCSGKTFATEVVSRRVDDRGGGLARIVSPLSPSQNDVGVVRMVEGLAMPRGDLDERLLSYYSSMTTWIDLDKFLDKVFGGLTREDIIASNETDDNLFGLADRVDRATSCLPTYVTIKNVKQRWGNGQEDVLPVAQYERLWGDLAGGATSLVKPEDCAYYVVPRVRGQQLKDPATLDGWMRDGSSNYVESLCRWKEEEDNNKGDSIRVTHGVKTHQT